MKDTYPREGQSKAVKIGAAVVLVALVGIVLYASFSSFDFVGKATDPFNPGVVRDCVDGQFYQINDPEGNAKLFRCQGNEFGDCDGTVCSRNKRITIQTESDGVVDVTAPDPSGTGDITPKPQVRDAPQTFSVPVGRQVTLQAMTPQHLTPELVGGSPNPFYSKRVFREWVQGSSGVQQAIFPFPVTKDTIITARWETQHKVTMFVKDHQSFNANAGSVTIALENFGNGQHQFYPDAIGIIAEAHPAAGFRFLEWRLEFKDEQSSGSVSLKPAPTPEGKLVRTIDKPYILTAVFDPLYTLAASTAGNGEGVVRVTGIDCGSPAMTASTICSKVYNRDTVITLEAVASTTHGSVFTAWTDGAGNPLKDATGATICATGNTCTIKMSDHKQVKATFLKELVMDVAIKLHVDPSQLSCDSDFIEKARWQHSSELCTFGGCGMLTISYLACLEKDTTGPFVGKIKTFATTGDDCDPVEVQQGSSTAANAGMLSPDPKTLLCRYYALSDGNQAARENYEDIQIGQACSEGYTSLGTFIADVSPPSGLTANHGTFHVCAKTHKETELPSFIIRRPDNFGSPQQISVPCYKDAQRNIVCDVHFYAPVAGAYSGTATALQGWKVVKVDAVDGQNVVATHSCTQSLQTAACDFSLNGVPPDLNKMYIARVTVTEIDGTVLCEVPITAPVFDAGGVFTGFGRTALTQPIGVTLGVREACAEFDVFGKRDPANAPSATAYEGIATTVNGIVADDGNAENGVETGVVQFGSLEHLRCTYKCNAIPQGVQVKSCKDLGALDVGPLTVNANEYFDIAPESSTCG